MITIELADKEHQIKMIKRQESNYHDAYHRGRSHTRREKLPPIPERAGRSPVRRRMPAMNADAAEDRNDCPTTAFSASSDRTSMKPTQRLSVPSIPSRTYLPILPPAHLDDESASTLTVELGEPNIRNVGNGSNATEAEKLSDAVTPSIRNISRKHISTVIGSSCDDTRSVSANQTDAIVKNYAPEPTWMDFHQISNGAADEPPELSSIPTDEIIDSFVEPTTSVECPVDDENSKEMTVINISRETRDQYQLDRLQARINQRREMQSKIIYKEHGAPNYKTLRSSRIKSVRNLYNPNPSIIQHQKFSSHVSVANTKSTIPSLEHGHKISPSMASSVSVLRSSLCDTELSEYRGKAFTEMLQLLMNNPSFNKDIQLADASNLDAIAQNLVELEMSRILHDFEQNNSLIETSCTAASNAIPSSARSDRTKEHNPPMECTKTVEDFVTLPEKITFNDNGMSITSKLSDVTSPTCHDGFELDEIIPSPHRLSRWERTTTNYQPKSPSPVAAAAASVAASMISAPGGNKKYGDTLPSVLEFPEQNELDASDEYDITEDSGVFDTIKSPSDVQCPTSALLKTTTNQGSEDVAKRAAEEVTFHDEILSVVANDAEELMEVISILSKYEEAEVVSKQVDNVVGVLSLDEPIPSKKVTFFEPLQQDPTCGCFIQ